MNECEVKNFAVNISKILMDILSLEELTPQILHSLVEQITCTHEGKIHLYYPLEIG